ncbi:unnamed protein product [Rotaria magnacalcarata]|uniref:Uncharacterized protein n=1 Tax=Rotaria magnacalcarata TaxID=392030 RepID=A0A816UJE8_9BILA|nr:unnamed protein product [Rotaria magnacalcarata]
MAYVSYLHMEKTYRQPARPEPEFIPMKENEPATTENDDASSVASSLYNRRDIISTPKDPSLPISANLQYEPSNSQQHATNLTNRIEPAEQRSVYKLERDRTDSRTSNKGSASSKEQSLISSTSTSNQEPDEPPNVPRKTYKTTNAKLRNNYYNQSDV